MLPNSITGQSPVEQSFSQHPDKAMEVQQKSTMLGFNLNAQSLALGYTLLSRLLLQQLSAGL